MQSHRRINLKAARRLFKQGIEKSRSGKTETKLPRFQLTETGKSFGTRGKPVIRFNYLYMSDDWANQEDDVFYYETFLGRLGLLDHYEFVVSNKPEYVFISCYGWQPTGWPALKHFSYRAWCRLTDGNGFDPASDKFCVPEVEGPFVRIFFCSENVRTDLAKCEWSFGYDYDDVVNHPNHMRLPCYLFAATNDTLSQLSAGNTGARESVDDRQSNRKFCAFLHERKVPIRDELFDLLSGYRRVDSPGLARNNMPKPDYLEDSRRGGFDESKLKFLSEYKFTLSCENELADGYTTEKMIQPILAGSVPIYYGNKRVHRDINTKALICLSEDEWKLPKKKRMALLLERVIEADQSQDVYRRYLEQPLFAQNQFDAISETRILKQFQKIFSDAGAQ